VLEAAAEGAQLEDPPHVLLGGGEIGCDADRGAVEPAGRLPVLALLADDPEEIQVLRIAFERGLVRGEQNRRVLRASAPQRKGSVGECGVAMRA